MTRTFLKYWVPVLIWLAVIFSASGDRASGQHSSRIIEPILRWLVPDISPKKLSVIVHTVRKTAHVTEYAILALLLFRAVANVGRSVRGEPSAFPVRAALFAFALAVLYAMTDEFHQTFVPSRRCLH